MVSEWAGDEGDHWAAHAARYTRMLGAFGEALVQAADLPRGARVLDVGCGCGDLSLAAAEAVGPTGQVVGVDLSPAMLAVAAERARARGLDQVRFEQADAASYRPPTPGHTPAEPDAGFDVVVSRFGIMFFEDPAAALAHLRSLVSPGGRLVALCWQALAANEWMVVPGLALAEVLPLTQGRDPTAPGPFAFADAERVVGLLAGAGWHEPVATAVHAPMWLGPSASDCADFLASTGLGRALLAQLDADLVAEGLRRVARALAPHESRAGVELDGAAWLLTAGAGNR